MLYIRGWMSSKFGHIRPHGLWSKLHLGVTRKSTQTYKGENSVSAISQLFLAHLSQRFIGELKCIVYPCSGVRRCCRRPPFLNVFSSETAWPIKAKILCGASLGRGNESLSKWSRSHDQDGRQAHIW